MRQTILLLVFFAGALSLASCSGDKASNAATLVPISPTFEDLLEQAGMEKARIVVEYETTVPDSLKADMAVWVTETVRAASNRLSAGDYEDPEDLVEETVDQAKEVWARERRTVYLAFLPMGEDFWEWVKPEDLTPAQKRVFGHLNQ